MSGPIVGALSEVDGRNFMTLMDMSRFLVNEITQEHDFKDVADASKLRVERMDLAASLTAKMWSYWQSAPAGPGVFPMLLSWCKQQANLQGQGSMSSIRKREQHWMDGHMLPQYFTHIAKCYDYIYIYIFAT